MLSLLSSYTLRFGILTLFLAMSFSISTVSAQEVPASSGCYRITGFSTAQTNANIDEGQLDFNNANPNDLYKACVIRQSAVSNRYDLEGWVWNSNLGWVSLQSKAGLNRTLSAGGHAYESYAEVLNRDAQGNITSGELKGYWWGDNLGWLSLNCATGSYCGVSNHKVVFGVADTNGKYPLSGYAWSDNLGWVNMANVVLDLNQATYTFNPTVQVVGSGARTKMYANGVTNYDVRVKFFDSAGVDQTLFVSSNMPNLDFCLLFSDMRKTVYNPPTVVARNFSVLTGCGGYPTSNTFGANLNLDYKASDLANSEFVYNAAGNYFGLKTDKKIKSELSAQIGDLVLNKIKFNAGIVKVVDVNANLEFVEPFNYKILPFSIDNALGCTVRPDAKFGLTLGITSPFAYCGSNYFTTAVPFTVSLNLPGNIGAQLGLYTENAAGEIANVVPATNSAINYEFELKSKKVISSFMGFSNFNLLPTMAEGVAPILSEILSENFNSQGINTVISYTPPSGSGVVTRSGPSLQSVDLRIDQIATKGSIEDRAFNQIRLDAGSTTSGGASGVQVREKLLRQIYNLTAGKGNFSCSAASDIGFSNLLFNLPGVDSSVQPDKCRIAVGQEVYYIGYSGSTRTSKTIVNVDQIDEMIIPTVSNKKPKVLILVGADLIIDKNLYADDSDVNRPAIILLKNSAGKGGNVYFTSDVVDINAYIYADKTIYSVEDVADVGTSADERPDRDGQINDKMFSQIAFVGRFWSQNCIGCSQLAVPLKGDGSIALNSKEAQDYDLNLWRYSPLKFTFATNTDGEKVYVACNGDPSDDPYDPEYINTEYLCWKDKVGNEDVIRSNVPSVGDFESSQEQSKRRSVNIIYKAPPKDLPIFSGL